MGSRLAGDFGGEAVGVRGCRDLHGCHGGYRESHQADAVHGRNRGISRRSTRPPRASHAAPLSTAASSSGRDQRDTMDSGSTNRKSSSAHTSAVSSNSETKVSASGPAAR